ncbi:hypothetical protein NG796_16860 [Laspinema sp. A4]|uniref:hypothetical protein n=1 Tax=Laspinema sp. D2d TaxID=2953686 RepID=UPI0021BB96CD|nr:hypothetical protein [Laspinema sp. D2d]MCT7984944.1 hypothetical protein [Laspinema sp. D2d]
MPVQRRHGDESTSPQPALSAIHRNDPTRLCRRTHHRSRFALLLRRRLAQTRPARGDAGQGLAGTHRIAGENVLQSQGQISQHRQAGGASHRQR